MERDDFKHINPYEIEKKSFEIIEDELKNIHHISIDESHAHIIMRVIHTTADFSYARSLYFSKGFDEACDKLFKEGGFTVVTDTSMALSGINKPALKRAGGNIICFMKDEAVASEAKARGITRAYVSMEHAAGKTANPVFVIGNAPTALASIYDLYQQKRVEPKLIIAAPVGFVNVVEAKELIEQIDAPMVVARGRSGGSNVAAAIMNAILYGGNDASDILR